MWFDGVREDNTFYVANVSRGKDSTAMLRAIEFLKFPLDAIIAVDVFFDENTPAELPDMVAFKDDWDEKAFKTFGHHVIRVNTGKTYKDLFYSKLKNKRKTERFNSAVLKPKGSNPNILGFPMRKTPWCNSNLKTNALRASAIRNACCKALKVMDTNQKIIHYVGIAYDEPERIARHIKKKDMVLPLVQIGWDEDLCGLEAQYLDMLSPTYRDGTRDGCWFCHNQNVNSLRLLRKEHPDLFGKLLEIDTDSFITFHADGKTVHDYDERFMAEDCGLCPKDRTFKWRMLHEDLQLNLFWKMQ